MFGKSTQIGLVSLLVVLAATLGGCAESVGSEPANFSMITRNQVAIVRYTPHAIEGENGQVVKVDSLASSKSEGKHALHGVADVR